MTTESHTVPWPADESWGVSPIDPRTKHAGREPVLEFETEAEAINYGYQAWPLHGIALWVRVGPTQWRRVYHPDGSFADFLEALWDCGVDMLPETRTVEGFRDWFAQMRREGERAERQTTTADAWRGITARGEHHAREIRVCNHREHRRQSRRTERPRKP